VSDKPEVGIEQLDFCVDRSGQVQQGCFGFPVEMRRVLNYDVSCGRIIAL
jgi:hypothetical protein